MNRSLAEYVRTRCRAIAVCNAFRLAPWTDALVCNDATWWEENPDAMQFAGRKFCGVGHVGCERIPRDDVYSIGLNSGLQGMRVAEMLGATRLLLLGFDMHSRNGAHFFGPHPAPLRNTSNQRFKVHIAQFQKWAGCEVVNCTHGSALMRFPFGDVHEILETGR
jgi:hypothetical protein